MTDTSREAWNGRPQNPERTGPHWIEDRSLNHVACVVWCHVMEQWHDMAQTMTLKGAAKFWRYLGPCLTLDEVAALLAERDAARAKALEEAALIAESKAREMSALAVQAAKDRPGETDGPTPWCVAFIDIHIAQPIRALAQEPQR